MPSLLGRRHYCSKPCAIAGAFQSKEEDRAVETVGALLGEEPLRQHHFTWLVSSKNRRMYVDAFFPSAGLVVEYDGRFHREYMPHYHRDRTAFRRTLERDREKAALLAANYITLLRIRDDEPQSRVALGLIIESLQPLLPLGRP